ncbi:MAG TPA: hypothetical protein VGE15_08465 [Sphingobacteriaceae bacterium]
MKKYLSIHFLAMAVAMLVASCNSSPEKVPGEGDSGDSSTLGAGSDTTGVTVDTSSSVTDSVY